MHYRLVTKETRNGLQIIAYIMEVSPRIPKNKRSSLVLVRKLSTELWILLLMRWYSYNLFQKTRASQLLCLCLFSDIMTI